LGFAAPKGSEGLCAKGGGIGNVRGGPGETIPPGPGAGGDSVVQGGLRNEGHSRVQGVKSSRIRKFNFQATAFDASEADDFNMADFGYAVAKLPFIIKMEPQNQNPGGGGGGGNPRKKRLFPSTEIDRSRSTTASPLRCAFTSA